MIKPYIKEIKYLRHYLILNSIIIILSSMVIILLDENTINSLSAEDSFFEYLTAINLFIASLFFIILFVKTKNVFFLILFLICFFGTGEEISWGQRIFNFETPENLNKINVQKEYNIHNIVGLNYIDLHGNPTQGIKRLCNISVLSKLFLGFFGFVLPFLVYNIKMIRRLVLKIRLPIPAITIGAFFILDYIIFKILLFSRLAKGSYSFHNSVGEIFEFIESSIFFSISLFFYYERKKIVIGKDIKQILL